MLIECGGELVRLVIIILRKASRVQLFRKRSASYNLYNFLVSCFSEKTLTPRSPRYKEHSFLTARLTRFLNNYTLRAFQLFYSKT